MSELNVWFYSLLRYDIICRYWYVTLHNIEQSSSIEYLSYGLSLVSSPKPSEV